MAPGAPRVSGVVLAAGSSRRLGRPKQLLGLGGEPLLRHTVRNAKTSSLDEVIVVLGDRASEIRDAFDRHVARVVVNRDFAAGQSGSLIVGVQAIDPACDAAMILLGDQPLVSTAAIDRLVSAYRTDRSTIVQATYGDVPGNPVLFDRSLLGDLTAVTGDEGARSVVRRHRDLVTVVEVGDVADVIDVDTEADYARLVELWAERRGGDVG